MLTTQVLAIFIFCLIGCGLTSWKMGISAGIQASVQYFVDEGVIELEEED